MGGPPNVYNVLLFLRAILARSKYFQAPLSFKCVKSPAKGAAYPKPGALSLLVIPTCGGYPRIRGCLFRGLHKKSYSILGSIYWGSLNLKKLHSA